MALKQRFDVSRIQSIKLKLNYFFQPVAGHSESPILLWLMFELSRYLFSYLAD